MVARGRLGWSRRRIEAAIGVRRETAGGYLSSAGPGTGELLREHLSGKRGGIISAPRIARAAHRHHCFNCWRAPTRQELTLALSATPSMLARAKVTQKQKPRGRLWLNDGSCVRLRPTHANHVWSYDFVSARTHDGRTVRLLNLIDESTRECLFILGERRWSSARVIGALADVMVVKDVPEHL